MVGFAEGGDDIVRGPISSWILVSLLLVSGSALSDSSACALPTGDWNVDASQARKNGRPTLILFTSEYCSYCERLKTEVLEPLVKSGRLMDRASIRELDIAHGGKIRDFDGEKVRTRVFVKRYGIYATPTLMLVDHEGAPIGTPVVGFNNSDDYRPNLERLIGVIGITPPLAGARTKPAESQGSSRMVQLAVSH
jgi:thioredoxin-related protein